jgi:hypothetical protein
MHKIDLLKGQGIPAKTTTGGVIILTLAVVIPLLVAVGLLDWYLQTKIDIEVMQQRIITGNETISRYTPDLKLKKSLDQQIAILNNQLLEVSHCLDTFIQWSPILITLSENMPSRMIMNRLTTQCTSASARRTRKNTDSNKPVSLPIPERTMVMNISGSRPGSYVTMVQEYQESLSLSLVLRPKLKDIIPSTEASTIGTDQTESYIMNIIFKSGLK